MFAAMYADRSFPTADSTTLILVVLDDVLDGEMLFDAVGPRTTLKLGDVCHRGRDIR